MAQVGDCLIEVVHAGVQILHEHGPNRHFFLADFNAAHRFF
ncbi:MAG: hypothetical protein ACJ71Q_07315 [Terriglobales bacterium]|jgi:hypothetical protein